MVKPTAIVFAHPFEGRTSYFLAGLSHYYDLEIYYPASKRFRFSWQTFYKWQYSKGTKFVKCESLLQFDSVNKKYDAAFLFLESYHYFLPWPLGHAEILDSVRKVKQKVKDVFWLEIGERQYFTFGRQEFWDLISVCLKGQVFKKEFEHILKDKNAVSLFQDPKLVGFPELVKENEILDLEKNRSKILPFPFTPTITDIGRYDFSKYTKVYDWAANTRTVGNGVMRCQVIEAMQKNLPTKYSYSIEYNKSNKEIRHARNSQVAFFDPYLIPYIGSPLFKVNFGKYFYAQPLYWHNLTRSRCYMGLGFTFSSLRSADAWGAGTVLLNFSFKKCDYGIPVEDGYNYVSIGERDEMSVSLNEFKPEFTKQVCEKAESILSDREKQKRIAENAKQTFVEYFSTPQQFVKKIFLEKLSFFS